MWYPSVGVTNFEMLSGLIRSVPFLRVRDRITVCVLAGDGDGVERAHFKLDIFCITVSGFKALNTLLCKGKLFSDVG